MGTYEYPDYEQTEIDAEKEQDLERRLRQIEEDIQALKSLVDWPEGW